MLVTRSTRNLLGLVAAKPTTPEITATIRMTMMTATSLTCASSKRWRPGPAVALPRRCERGNRPLPRYDDHPGHAEAVCDHAEARGEECLVQGQLDLPPVGQGGELAVGLGLVLHRK